MAAEEYALAGDYAQAPGDMSDAGANAAMQFQIAAKAAEAIAEKVPSSEPAQKYRWAVEAEAYEQCHILLCVAARPRTKLTDSAISWP